MPGQAGGTGFRSTPELQGPEDCNPFSGFDSRNREARVPMLADELTFLDLVLEGQPRGIARQSGQRRTWRARRVSGARTSGSAERGAGVACWLTTALCGDFAAALPSHAFCKLLGGMSPLSASLAALSSRRSVGTVGRTSRDLSALDVGIPMTRCADGSRGSIRSKFECIQRGEATACFSENRTTAAIKTERNSCFETPPRLH